LRERDKRGQIGLYLREEFRPVKFRAWVLGLQR
jgi:hypothetical protein